MNASGVPNACKSNEPILSVSGKRLSNAQVTCPRVGNNSPKGELIPHDVRFYRTKALALGDGLVSYQVVGEVKAHQARDG